MKNIKNKIKFKTFLMLISNLIAASFMLILAFRFYLTTENFINNRKNQIELGNYNHIKLGIDKNINDIKNIASSIINDNKLLKWINENEDPVTTVSSKRVIEENIQALLSYKRVTNNAIKCIIVNTYKNQYSSVPVFLLSSKIKGNMLHKYNNINGNEDNNIDINEDNNIDNNMDISFHSGSSSSKEVRMSGVIENLDNETYFKCSLIKHEKYYGDVYILLKDDFFDLLVDHYENVFILDKKHNFLSPSNNKYGLSSQDIRKYSYENKYTYREEKFTVYKGEINYNDWKLMYLADKIAFEEQLKSIKMYLLISLVISLSISLIFSNYISIAVLKPINVFVKVFKNYNLNADKLDEVAIKEKSYRFSLREKIFYYFLITVILPTCIFSWLSYFKINDITKIQFADEYELVFKKTAERISDYFSKKILVFSRLIYGNPAQEYWSSLKDEQKLLFLDDIKLNIYLGLEDDKISIYDNNNVILASNCFAPEPSISRTVFPYLINSGKQMYWYSEYDKLGNPRIGIGTKVSSFLHNNRLKDYIGYATLNIDYKNIEELFSGLKNDNTIIFMSDRDGKNIFSKKIEESCQQIFQNISFDESNGVTRVHVDNKESKHFLYYKKLDKTPWYFVAKYNYKDLLKQSNLILNNEIYILISMFLFIMLLSYYISFKVLNPVNNMNKVFEVFEIGEYYESEINDYYIDEIDDLRINFNRMIERIEDLFDELLMVKMKKSEVEIEKKRTEIVALQAQINPHFLYNTLDSIIYLIENYQNDKAANIVKSLGHLFRFGISRTDTIITIREEVEYAKAYTDIISIRNNNNISFEWDIPSQTLKYRIIKLILQPIIENAVYHGINNMKSNVNGIIKIQCIEEDNRILFAITDNGKGITRENLQQIKQDLKSYDIGNRVGIYNVQSRIKLYYGENYGLDIESEHGKGTVVKIIIPKTKHGDVSFVSYNKEQNL